MPNGERELQPAKHYLVQESVRLNQEVLQRNRELAALNAIAAAVSQSLDLKEVLDAALEETLAVLNVEGGLIYLSDEISQTFLPAVHRGISQDVLREVTGFKMGEGLSGWVAESDEMRKVIDGLIAGETVSRHTYSFHQRGFFVKSTRGSAFYLKSS